MRLLHSAIKTGSGPVRLTGSAAKLPQTFILSAKGNPAICAIYLSSHSDVSSALPTPQWSVSPHTSFLESTRAHTRPRPNIQSEIRLSHFFFFDKNNVDLCAGLSRK